MDPPGDILRSPRRTSTRNACWQLVALTFPHTPSRRQQAGSWDPSKRPISWQPLTPGGWRWTDSMHCSWRTTSARVVRPVSPQGKVNRQCACCKAQQLKSLSGRGRDPVSTWQIVRFKLPSASAAFFRCPSAASRYTALGHWAARRLSTANAVVIPPALSAAVIASKIALMELPLCD